MTIESIIEALDLPAKATAGQRTVPKKELVEAGGLKGKDARLVRESVEKIRWVAVLKPETVGIQAFSDEVRDVSEVSILTLEVRRQKDLHRLEELIHRATPYHVLLLTDAEGAQTISTARKRRSRAEQEAFVMDGQTVRASLSPTPPDDEPSAFLTSLNLSARQHASLAGLYDHWTDAIVSLGASQVTGTFTLSVDREQARAREAALREHAALTGQVAHLRKRAEKATQARTRVELNTELQAVRKSLDRAVRILAQEET